MPLLVHPDSTCDVCLSNYDWDNPEGIGTGTPHAIACGHIFCKSCLNQVISNNSSSFLAASTAGTAPCPLCRKLYVRIKAKKLHVDRPDPPKMPEYLGHLERLASCCHEKSTAATWEDAIRHTVQWLEEQQPDECVSVRRMLRLVESTRAHEARIADLNNMLTAGPSSSRKQDEYVEAQDTIEGLRKQLQDAISTAKKLEKKLIRREKKTQPAPLPVPPQPIPDEFLPEFLRHTLMPNSPDNRRPYAEYEERNGVYPGSFSDIYQPEVSYHSSSMPGGFYTPDEGLDELVDEFGYRVTTQDEGSSVWPAPGPGSSTQDLPLGFSPFPPPSERYTRSRTTAPGASSSSRTLPSSRTIPSTTSRPRSSAERRTQSSADYSDRRRSIAAIHPNGRARGSAADEVIVYEAPHEALAPVSSRLELPVYTGPESIYALSPVSTPAPASRTRPHVNLRVDTSRTSEGSRRSSINSWDTVSNPRSDNSLGLNMMDFNAGYGAAGGRHQTSRRGSRSSLSSELSQSAVAHSFLQPSARDSTNSRRGSQTYQGGVPTIEEEDSPVEDQGFDDYRFGGHGHGRTGFEAFDPIPPPLSNESSRTIVPGLGHRSYSSQDASSASASQEQRRNARRTASYDSWNTSMGYAQAVDQTDDSSGIHNQPRRGHGNSLGLDLGEPEIAHPRPGYARGGIGYDSQAMRMLPGSPSRQHTASARVTQASW